MAGRNKSKKKKKYHAKPRVVKKTKILPVISAFGSGGAMGFLLGRFSRIDDAVDVASVEQSVRALDRLNAELSSLSQHIPQSDTEAAQLRATIQSLKEKLTAFESVLQHGVPSAVTDQSTDVQLRSYMAWDAPLFPAFSNIVFKVYTAVKHLNQEPLIAERVNGFIYGIFVILEAAKTSSDTLLKSSAHALLGNLASRPINVFIELLNQPLIGASLASIVDANAYLYYWNAVYFLARNQQRDISNYLITDINAWLAS